MGKTNGIRAAEHHGRRTGRMGVDQERDRRQGGKGRQDGHLQQGLGIETVCDDPQDPRLGGVDGQDRLQRRQDADGREIEDRLDRWGESEREHARVHLERYRPFDSG